MSGLGQDTEPEAKVVHIKRLYRAVVELIRKLDVTIANKTSYRDVFKPENISLRNKLRELCVKLMFLHPADYGRKAEELLWRKVYYEVIQVVKINKKHVHSRSSLECAYRTHLVAGVGFYQHLLLYIQSHYQLELQDCIDWTHVTDPLIGRKKLLSATAKEMEWAQMACHRCLVYLGDLARYQNELAGVDTGWLAERFYHQALSVSPHVGMPFNQLGTLAGSRFYNVEATYFYLRCIQTELPFEGAYGNLKRVFEKAAKMHHQLRRLETRKLPPWRQRSKDVKRLLVGFLHLQSLLQPKSSLLESELTSLCQSVLEDFNLVLFYLPATLHSAPPTGEDEEEEEELDDCFSFLPDVLVFKMVVTCLMVVHNLKRAGSKQYSTSIAFTLALFSHLVNHVNIRLQADLEEGEPQVPPLPSGDADDLEVNDVKEMVLQNGSVVAGEGVEKRVCGGQGGGGGEENVGAERLKQRKFSRLSMLRRRRYAGQEDESDLSEGFESEEEEEEEEVEEEEDEEESVVQSGKLGSPCGLGPLGGPPSMGVEGPQDRRDNAGDWDTGSEEEEGGTAFDVETDSDMNSQESRSDLEDMEDPEVTSRDSTAQPADGEEEPSHPANHGSSLSRDPSDPSITSSLQAVSSQLFQAKRCFRLAPTFSNMLLRPQTPSAGRADPTPSPVNTPSEDGPKTANGPNDNDAESDTEGSEHSIQSVRSEKSLVERLEILTNQDLLPVVKVFVDWLRTNTDIIVMCAPSSQSLWNRLSVLLNLIPDGSKMLEADLGLNEEVTEMLSHCEQPSLVQTLVLPEDLALRHLPALNSAHQPLDFNQERPHLDPLQECVVRLCCIRNFGHFLTSLQGNVLHFNPEAGIFTSISQSEQENLVQQAKAQIRMAEQEARRNRLMRDMAHLRLQLEVSQLEGSLQQPKGQSSLSPYLVPDTAALCQHLGLVRQLAESGHFIVVIPRAVVDGLDVLKKESAGARDGIRFLESELRKGNRYIRCQKESGRGAERDKLKRQDPEAWHLQKLLDSCRLLTVSQGADEDTAGMVTILTGRALEELSAPSPAMKGALQAVAAAGVELKGVQEFYRQWKEIG